MDEQKKLGRRFAWADKILTEAGFVAWSFSDAHGSSHYYIPLGSETRDESDVRIRVSDHYANQLRSDMGKVTVDFTVVIKHGTPRANVEKAALTAIQERKEYLESDDWKELAAEKEAERTPKRE